MKKEQVRQRKIQTVQFGEGKEVPVGLMLPPRLTIEKRM